MEISLEDLPVDLGALRVKVRYMMIMRFLWSLSCILVGVFRTSLQFEKWILLSTIQNIMCCQKGLCCTINIKNKAKQTVIQIYFHNRVFNKYRKSAKIKTATELGSSSCSCRKCDENKVITWGLLFNIFLTDSISTVKHQPVSQT